MVLMLPLMLMLPWLLLLLLLLLWMLPASCVHFSLTGILGAQRPARFLGLLAAPQLPPPQSLKSPSGARAGSRWMPGAGKRHSDTGGQPGSC
ncbi:hypothetical protein STEG23_003078 [Scotinomys teguina]